MEVWSFQPKNITQKPAFLTAHQYWLGIAKPKTPFQKVVMKKFPN